MVNAIFSLSYLWARENRDSALQATVEVLYADPPKLQDNQVIRQIADRIFSEEQPAKSISPNVKKQQGMIKLYQDFCAAKSCEICPIVYGAGRLSCSLTDQMTDQKLLGFTTVPKKSKLLVH